MTLLMQIMAATKPASNGVLMSVRLRIGIRHCCDERLPDDSELSRGGSCQLSVGIPQRRIPSMKVLILAAAALAAVIGSARAENGIASHYSTREQGIKTASGRSLHDGALTAAHKRLPFGSRVRVTNHANGRSVVVTITDRGPYVRGRVIDLTTAGARALGFSGIARVSVERIGKES
jgi:peptidoglycan lytic transglycosylase